MPRPPTRYLCETYVRVGRNEKSFFSFEFFAQ